MGDRLSVAVVNATADPEVRIRALEGARRDDRRGDPPTRASSRSSRGDDQARDVVFTPTEQDEEYELSAVLRIPGTWVVNCFVLVESGDLEYPIVLTATDDERE